MALSFEVRTGRLIHEAPPALTVLMPWPLMAAFRVARPRDPWVACQPAFTLVPEHTQANDAAGAAPGGAAEYEGLAELRKFCALIPRDVRTAVAPFQERHWHLLSWMARGGPASEQLLAAHPALAFSVASGAELTTTDTPIGFVRKQSLMAYHPQRDLLARFGFTPTEQVRRILRRVPPHHVTVALIARFRVWLQDEHVRERLAHVHVINSAVLRVLEDGTLRHLTPAALVRLSQAADETAAEHAARRLAEVVRLWGLVRPTCQLPRFGRVERIERANAEVREDVTKLRAAASSEFPPPPVPGTETIVPITTKAMLIEEGRLQKNCAGDYLIAAKRGRLAFYRVLDPQRCTLSLREKGGHWTVDQFKAACNANPSPEAVLVLRRWLREARLGVAPPATAPEVPTHPRDDGGQPELPF